jgi:hypothetical protein
MQPGPERDCVVPHLFTRGHRGARRKIVGVGGRGPINYFEQDLRSRSAADFEGPSQRLVEPAFGDLHTSQYLLKHHQGKPSDPFFVRAAIFPMVLFPFEYNTLLLLSLGSVGSRRQQEWRSMVEQRERAGSRV